MPSSIKKQKAKKKKESGCGCGLFMLLSMVGAIAGLWWLWPRLHRIDIETARNGDLAAVVESLLEEDETKEPVFEPAVLPAGIPNAEPVQTTAADIAASPGTSSEATLTTAPVKPPPAPPTPTNTEPALPAVWKDKAIRGIYLSRYQVTNRASEQTIRDRVRYYKSQGINTIIHGVWGNGCTMYPSDVMQQTFGLASCPNLFEDQWLDWMLDEANKQGMQIHAYFEKGIKLDKNSPIFDIATRKGWFVPGIDKTYPSIDHYILNVENPEVVKYFTDISAEFARKYPTIDAVQWDDYVGYHEELPGDEDRTPQLTKFMLGLRAAVKAVNPKISFDVCHHNPYWGKRYFDADWANWNVDRAFIQVYNDDNFEVEMDYVQQHDGIAISDNQFNRLEALANNPNVNSVLLFPSSGKPEETAAKFRDVWKSAAPDTKAP
ncbi:MAG: family 10 glycosylhydrolase [Cyanobacteria bacterium J06631_9]